MPPPGKDVFRRNGFEVSYASVTLKVDNDQFWGVVGIDYEEKITREFVRGLGKAQAPRGKTRGEYSVEGSSLKMYKTTAIALYEKLWIKSGKRSISAAPFYFSLQYVEESGDGGPGISITEELHGVHIDGRKSSGAKGSEAIIEEVPISILYVTMTTPNCNRMTIFDNRDRRY